MDFIRMISDKSLTLALFMLASTSIFCQVSLPYSNSFDSPNDTIGWSHYALFGNDDWELGAPDQYNLSYPFSSPNAWVTDLDQNYSPNSQMVLVTPEFDLSDTTEDVVLFFWNLRERHTSSNFYVDYSDDGGSSWSLLVDPGANSTGWQNTNGFTGNASGSYRLAGLNIRSFQGPDPVQFRFRLKSLSSVDEGWSIDNYRIEKAIYNVTGLNGDTISISENCSLLEFNSKINFYHQLHIGENITSNYYLSTDTVLDLNDTLLDSIALTLASSLGTNDFDLSLQMPQGITPGVYYILQQHDVLNEISETDETDNSSYTVITIVPVHDLPYISDLESVDPEWDPDPNNEFQFHIWELGSGYRHHIEGTHSGSKAWHTSAAIHDYSEGTYLESPFFDLSVDTGDNVLNLWFKSNYEISFSGNWYRIYYLSDCFENWEELFIFPRCRNDEWDFINIDLDGIPQTNNTKFRIHCGPGNSNREGLVLDDFYIGKKKADLTIEGTLSELFTTTLNTSGTLKYLLVNSGLQNAASSTISFYWSTDSILDPGDTHLGNDAIPLLADTSWNWRDFQYTKPTTDPGIYYIHYQLDVDDDVNEMREDNNLGYFRIHQQGLMSGPYYNDFETQIFDWRHNASLGSDDWEWAIPNGSVIDTAFSGQKGWITNADDTLSEMSRMHLYTPVFDLTTLTAPTLEFHMQLEWIGNRSPMNFSYSSDGGSTWDVLERSSSSYNKWYTPMKISSGADHENPSNTSYEWLFDMIEETFASFNDYNGRDVTRNYYYNLDISDLASLNEVQFRFNIAQVRVDTSQYLPFYSEGALIDDFRISESWTDLYVPYQKSLMISSLAQELRFFMDIKNRGNFISDSTTVNYYLSADSFLDAGDSFVATDYLPAIRPDRSFQINCIYSVPAALSNFEYLIYELDPNNEVAESNDLNNIGYWELALDSIGTYPYLMDFNDTILNGWNQYAMHNGWDHERDQRRFRNMLAPAEYTYTTSLKSGEMFTDQIFSGTSVYNLPVWYLETPAFDLSEVDSVHISFDLLCVGSPENDGGNFDYSVDGGNSWNLVTLLMGENHNWYSNTPNSTLDHLFDENGWTGTFGLPVLDSTSIDLSMLKGEPNVQFRFKFISKSALTASDQGMRIDNFLVQGYTADYVPQNNFDTIQGVIGQSSMTIDYSIVNSGDGSGRNSVSRFYWSSDPNLDPGDSLLATSFEPPIEFGALYMSNIEIITPEPIIQQYYYLLYYVDADSSILETNENNNIGTLVIDFSSDPNFIPLALTDSIYVTIQQPSFNVDYSIANNGLAYGGAANTGFYWSVDDQLDIGDPLIHSVLEAGISSFDTIYNSSDVIYPIPVSQPSYYLFYTTDHGSAITEANENDNTGMYVIQFDIGISINEWQVNSPYVYLSGSDLSVQLPFKPADHDQMLELISSNGQLILSKKVQLLQGANRIPLPITMATGIYLVKLRIGSQTYSLKFAVHP